MIDILVTIADCTDARMALLQRLAAVGLTGVRVIAKSRPATETLRMLERLHDQRARTGWPRDIWLDLPGARPRINRLRAGLTELTASSPVMISDGSASADIYVEDPHFWETLSPHHELFIADGTILLRVATVAERQAAGKVIKAGKVTAGRSIAIAGAGPAGRFGITPDDETLVRTATARMPVTVVLSWVSSAAQLRTARAMFESAALLPKLEQRLEGETLNDILCETPAVLIGRADLNAGLGTERMRQIALRYVAAARSHGVAAHVGSLIFDSLENSSAPSAADTADVSALLEAGARTFLLSGSADPGALHRKVAALAASAATVGG